MNMRSVQQNLLTILHWILEYQPLVMTVHIYAILAMKYLYEDTMNSIQQDLGLWKAEIRGQRYFTMSK